MDADPIHTAGRAAVRRRRLGPGAACYRCGKDTPETLLRVKRSLLEVHHVVGRANDADLTVVVCLNCHRELTEVQARDNVVLTAPPTLLCRVGRFLRGGASFLIDFAKQANALADELEASEASPDNPPRDVESDREPPPT